MTDHAGVDWRAAVADPDAGVDWARKVAAESGFSGIDVRAALAAAQGRFAIDWRAAVSAAGGRSGIDYRAVLAGRADDLTSLLTSLYGNGEQGAFYVPKPQVLDQQVLFQDAAGTTPVTADGDPVGLMLDLSQGLVRGPEIVQNGDFSRGMDEWDNRTVGNGQCEAVDGGIYVSSTDTDNRGGFSQSITGIVENGRSYIATYEISEVSGGGVHFGWGADYGGNHRYGHSYVTEPGVYSFIIPSLDGGQQVIWVRSHIAGGSGVISNISVRELPGNHAIQEVSGSRPVYRTDSQYHWLEFDGVDDGMTATLPNLGTDATEWWVDESGVTILTGQTIGAGVRGLPEVERLYAYGLLDRALTSQETDRLTSYLEGVAP